ncbi:MAG TPA: DUF1707 domain-containing protein [Acidimicrobiales bacterium]|nr:DUF1707 domain-containing protein [Acidimicrobiales bacterium]
MCTRHWAATLPGPPASRALPAPDQRIGDAEREQASSELRRHYTEGRLGTDEFSARLDEAWSARTAGDLDHALRDLPRPPVGPPPAAGRPRRPPTFLPVVAVVAGVALLVGARWVVVWLVVLALFVFARHHRRHERRRWDRRFSG